MEKFGQKIQELRKEKGLTQAELGDKLSVTAQAVSKWENDLAEPDLNTLKKISEVFGVSISELMGEEIQQKIEQPTVDNSQETAVAQNSTNATENKPIEQPKIIIGYCCDCHKPLYSTKEYTVTGRKNQPICHNCKAKREIALKNEILEEERSELKKGLIWGSVAGIIAIIAVIFNFTESYGNNVGEKIIFSVLTVYGWFAFICQLFYGGVVTGCMGFFIKTFRMPGVIFSFSIDGFIWAILVKIFLAILSVLLSVLWFLLGVFVTYAVGMVAFPFAIIKKIKECKAV